MSKSPSTSRGCLPVRPTVSYVIWYAPRSGSNLLCDALTSTGVAGRPEQYLSADSTFNLFGKYGVDNRQALLEAIWAKGTTPNGVFGLRCQMYEPYFENVLSYLAGTPGALDPACNRAEIWNAAFPNCRHILLSRRNKFRQAVSWAKARQSGTWFRETTAETTGRGRPVSYDEQEVYFFLMAAASSDAACQEFVAEGGISPINVIYEDFVADFEATVRRVVGALGIEGSDVDVDAPMLEVQRDDTNEQWLERFRADVLGEFPRRW